MSANIQIKIMKTMLEYLKPRIEYRELVTQVMEEQRSQIRHNRSNLKVATTGYNHYP